MARYIVGITGASGSIYGVRLVEELLKNDNEVYLVITENGREVLEYELETTLDRLLKHFEDYTGRLTMCNINDMFACIASGSFSTDGMVIIPCSMGTLSKLSCGITDNLLIRAADVIIKEKRKLILVPRETPLNSIHLRNMLTLSDLNVTIFPPVPSFYNKPKTIDEIINLTTGRILSCLGIENDLYSQWNGK